MAKALTAAEIKDNRERLLSTLNDDFLACRERMHAWEERTSFVSIRRGVIAREITTLFVCTRCTTERFDRISAKTHDLIGRRYNHPNGYLMPDSGFTKRADVRNEKFKRRPPLQEPPEYLQDKSIIDGAADLNQARNRKSRKAS